MKALKIALFLCLVVFTSCDDTVSFVTEEELTFDSFQAISTDLKIAPSQKIKIDGQSLSLVTGAYLLTNESERIDLDILAILSNTEAELKVPKNNISDISYTEDYTLVFDLKIGGETSIYKSVNPLGFLYLKPEPYTNSVQSINVKSIFEIAGKDMLGVTEVVVIDKSNGNERVITNFEQTNKSFSFPFPPIFGNNAIVRYSYKSGEGPVVDVEYVSDIEVVKENVEIGTSLEGLKFTPKSLLKIENKGAVNMDLIDQVDFIQEASVVSADILFQEEATLWVLVPQELSESDTTTLRLRYYDAELYKDTNVEILAPSQLPNITGINDYLDGFDDNNLSMAGGSTISFSGTNLGAITTCFMIDQYGNEVELVLDASSTDTNIKLVLPYVVSTGTFNNCRFIYSDGSVEYDYLSNSKIEVVGNPLEHLFFDDGGEKRESWAKPTSDGAEGYFDASGNPIPLMLSPGADEQHVVPSGSNYMGFRWNPSGGTTGTKLKTYMFYGIFGHATNDPPIGLSNAQKYLYFYYKTGSNPPPRLYIVLYNNGLWNSVPIFNKYDFSTENITHVPKKDGWLLCRVDMSKMDMKASGIAGLRAIRFAWIRFNTSTPDTEAFMDRMTISDRIMPNSYSLN